MPKLLLEYIVKVHIYIHIYIYTISYLKNCRASFARPYARRDCAARLRGIARDCRARSSAKVARQLLCAGCGNRAAWCTTAYTIQMGDQLMTVNLDVLLSRSSKYSSGQNPLECLQNMRTHRPFNIININATSTRNPSKSCETFVDSVDSVDSVVFGSLV